MFKGSFFWWVRDKNKCSLVGEKTKTIMCSWERTGWHPISCLMTLGFMLHSIIIQQAGGLPTVRLTFTGRRCSWAVINANVSPLMQCDVSSLPLHRMDRAPECFNQNVYPYLLLNDHWSALSVVMCWFMGYGEKCNKYWLNFSFNWNNKNRPITDAVRDMGPKSQQSNEQIGLVT